MKLNLKNIALASMFFMGAIAFSQQLDNNGFENWENVGSNNEEPIEWNSFYTASGSLTSYAEKTVWRDAAAHSGSYCARIETVSGPFGVVVNGNMTCGQVNMGSTVPSNSANHNITRTGNSDFHQALTTYPDSIVVWINYQGVGGDNGSVSAIIHDNFDYKFPESGTSADHAIAYAQQTFANTGGWTRVSIPFNYNSGASSDPAAFILVNLTPSAIPGGGNVGSKLYVDDIELIYNPVIITSTVTPLSYTVTNTNSDNIDIPFTINYGPMGAGNVFTAQLSDANGNFGAPTNIGTLSSTTAGTINATIPAGTPSGTGYRVRVIGTNPTNTIGSDNGQDITINLIGNSIAPSGSQSLLIGVDGNTLTVTENPAASSREWKFATVSGGPYSSFAPTETGTTYTPNFIASGTYYVICESVISGDNIVSNEVEINVGAATITTNPVNPTAFEFSPSSPNGNISVSFTTSGAFTPGNVFSVELSDASGSFAAPTVIGTLNSTTAGTISASIPNSTSTGLGYRVRVVGSNPNIIGSDNGQDISVDQYANSISPTDAQNLTVGASGSVVMVTETQSTTSRKWQYTTTSGSGYVDFSPTETGASYTPMFNQVGTFYVVALSTNIYGDEVMSEEVTINVTNGSTITTSTVFGSPINLSPSANVVLPVSFTSDAVFDPGNVFTAELSDATGDFSSPTVVGTLNGATIDVVDATIPVGTVAGTGYRIRITSSSPAIVGTACDNDLIVDQFSNTIGGTTNQTIAANSWGDEITISESQISTREWKYSTTSGSGYQSFTSPETNTNYFPNFDTEGTYYVVCESENVQWGDVVTSDEAVIIVDNSIGINENGNHQVSITAFNGEIMISGANSGDRFQIINMNGQVIANYLINNENEILNTNLPNGIYMFNLITNNNIHSGKLKL